MEKHLVRLKNGKFSAGKAPIRSAHKDLIEKDFEATAIDYCRAAQQENDKKKAKEYYLLAAEHFIKARRCVSARYSYESAIKFADGEEKETIAKTAVEKIIKQARGYMKEGNHHEAAEAAMNAVELETDKKKKKQHFILAGKNRMMQGAYPAGGDMYLKAIELAEDGEKDALRKSCLVALFKGARIELNKKDYTRAGGAYLVAAQTETDPGKRMEYFLSYGNCYAKAKYYGRAFAASGAIVKIIEKDEGHSIRKMDREKSIELIEKALWFSIHECRRSEVLEKLSVEYGLSDALLFIYNLKANGKIPEVNEKIKKLTGCEKNPESLNGAIIYLPTLILLKTNAAELLASSPKEFYELIRWGVVPFDDLVKYLMENRDVVENRALKKTDFDSSNPIHMAVEYGRYLAMLGLLLSKEIDKPLFFLSHDEFESEVNKPAEQSEMDKAEIGYLAYEIKNSMKVLREINDRFGGIFLVGNIRTGKHYADLMALQLKCANMFYTTSKMNSSVLHSQEYFLKDDLFNKVAIKNITSTNAKPVVVVDATNSNVKIPDAFKGYMSWAAGYDILLFKARGVAKEQIIEQVSDLALMERNVIERIYDEVTDAKGQFHKKITAWVKLNPHRKRPLRVHILDMDNVNNYRIKRDQAYYLPPRKGMEGLKLQNGDSVPMILLQPSLRIENIPAIVQEKIGTTSHKKGFMDDNSLARFMLRTDKNGVSMVSNIVELCAGEFSGNE